MSVVSPQKTFFAIYAFGAALLVAPLVSAHAEDGGWTLNVAVPDAGTTFDPIYAPPPRGIATVLNTYDTLMNYALKPNADGVPVRVPEQMVSRVLESMTPNADFTVWTLKLKRGLKFSDGSPVTTAALRFMFDRTFNFPNSGGMFIWKKVALIPSADSLKVLDDYTATVTTSAPMRILPQIFALSNSAVINPKVASLNSADPFGANYLKNAVEGGGPYKLESKGPDQIVLTSNPYFTESPKRASRIIERVVPDSSNRFAFLKKGVVDVALDLTPDEISSIENDKDIKVVSAANTNQIGLAMNTRTAPFDDVRVRKAISLALPSKRIADVVYHGRYQPAGGPVPIGVPGHLVQFDTFPSDDIPAAKAMLVGTALEKGGTLSLELMDDLTFAKIAVLVQQALAKLNITVNIIKLPPNIFIERNAKRELSMWVKWQNYSVADPVYVLQLGYTCNAFFNYGKYCNPEVDALIAKTLTEPDAVARGKLIDEIQTKIVADAPTVWIAQPNYNIAMRSNIAGYSDFSDTHARFEYLTKVNK